MIHPKDKPHQIVPPLHLAIVDFDSPIYRCAAVHEDDAEGGLISAKLELVAFVQNRIVNPLKCKQYLFVLTGDNNFRRDIWVTKEYKGSRKAEKPIHYLALKEWATSHFNCLVANGMEADDYVVNCHCRYQGTSVLAGIDKDNLQSPGWHYNYVKETGNFVTPLESQWLLAYQLLAGDAGDSIPGIPGIGDKKARTILKDSDKPPMLTAREVYLDKGLSQVMFDEQYALLYMLRDPIIDFESYFTELTAVAEVEEVDEGDFIGVEVNLS